MNIAKADRQYECLIFFRQVLQVLPLCCIGYICVMHHCSWFLEASISLQDLSFRVANRGSRIVAIAASCWDHTGGDAMRLGKSKIQSSWCRRLLKQAAHKAIKALWKCSSCSIDTILNISLKHYLTTITIMQVCTRGLKDLFFGTKGPRGARNFSDARSEGRKISGMETKAAKNTINGQVWSNTYRFEI